MPWFEFDGERDRFAAKVGYRCNGTRIAAPPRVADEMLASNRQPDECLDIAGRGRARQGTIAEPRR